MVEEGEERERWTGRREERDTTSISRVMRVTKESHV